VNVLDLLADGLRQLAMLIVVGVVRAEFPDVPSLSTRQLAQRLRGPEPAPLLIDNREPREFAVSHLPGARNLRSLAAIEAAGIPRRQPIVVYCTVGYRSAVLVRALRGAGYTNVVNLPGSIIQWHQQGHPVFAAGRRVRQVHPYDASWGRLLDPAALPALE
jgi:rhodanese-related sulfurtransferase